jgi:hypothetical protein
MIKWGGLEINILVGQHRAAFQNVVRFGEFRHDQI